MRSKGALIAVGLFVALGGSACGSFLLPPIATGGSGSESAPTIMSTTATLAVLPDTMLVDRSGTGSQFFGTFHLHGRLVYGISCKGKGHLQVYINSHPTAGTPCPAAGLGMGLARPTVVPNARIELRAPSSVHWQLRISEHHTK